MTTFGISMVKNEFDIIGYTLQNMVEQVDHVIIADNMSTDNTRDILEGFGDKVTVVEDNDPAYRQSEKMTKLAIQAKSEGATWVVPFDADEHWEAIKGGTIADALRGLDQDVAIAKMYNFVPTEDDSLDCLNPTLRMSYRLKEWNPLHKVACRTHSGLVIEMGNHSATYPYQSVRAADDVLRVRHYPWRSPDQFVNKAVQGGRALALTDLPDHMGAHWRQYNALVEEHGPEALKAVFEEHFYYKNPSIHGALEYDPI